MLLFWYYLLSSYIQIIYIFLVFVFRRRYRDKWGKKNPVSYADNNTEFDMHVDTGDTQVGIGVLWNRQLYTNIEIHQ